MNEASLDRDAVQVLDRETCVVELGDLAPLRLSGPDRREALQRTITQDVDQLHAGAGRLALLLAPKGQFRALFAILGGSDEFDLVPPPGRSEELRTGLWTYLRFSRSRLERWMPLECAVVAGPRWREAVEELRADPASVAAGGWSTSASGEVTLASSAVLGVDGALAMATDLADTRAVWSRLGFRRTGRASLELARIRNRFPAWGAELTATTLPPETGVERVAIAAGKGCYVGQETIARLQSRGHVNRVLVRVRQVAGPLTPPDLPLPLVAEGEEKPRGGLTSWAIDPTRGPVGLAMVHREVAAAGTRLANAGRVVFVEATPA